MVASTFANKVKHISDITTLTPTGSPRTFVHPRTGSIGIHCLEDGSRFADTAWVANTADTSITVGLIGTISLNNSGAGYFINGAGGTPNFECFLAANGSISQSILGSTGNDTHTVTGPFDTDALEKFFLFHFEDDKVSLFTGRFLDGQVMAEEADSQTNNSFNGWAGLATVAINATGNGNFPLELDSKLSDFIYWNNRDKPTVDSATGILASMLALGSAPTGLGGKQLILDLL